LHANAEAVEKPLVLSLHSDVCDILKDNKGIKYTVTVTVTVTVVVHANTIVLYFYQLDLRRKGNIYKLNDAAMDFQRRQEPQKKAYAERRELDLTPAGSSISCAITSCEVTVTVTVTVI
jgi:hypothetical protein